MFTHCMLLSVTYLICYYEHHSNEYFRINLVNYYLHQIHSNFIISCNKLLYKTCLLCEFFLEYLIIAFQNDKHYNRIFLSGKYLWISRLLKTKTMTLLDICQVSVISKRISVFFSQSGTSELSEVQLRL